MSQRRTSGSGADDVERWKGGKWRTRDGGSGDSERKTRVSSRNFLTEALAESRDKRRAQRRLRRTLAGLVATGATRKCGASSCNDTITYTVRTFP